MRIVIAGLIAAAGLLAACASKPAEEPVTKRVKVDASNVYEAQKAGYRIVNQNGQTLYCSKSLATGSRLKQKTACLTAEEWTRVNESARSAINDQARRVQPPLVRP